MTGAAGLKVHEAFTTEGRLVATHLRVEPRTGALVIADEEGAFPLPDGALVRVMDRYGAPLEPTERVQDVAVLEIGGGARIRHVRHLARYDVIARDYLVYEAPDIPPTCALATTVAAALGHLGRAVGR